ncbi:MAG TPA: tandem-type lipoprotein [Staphylococcus sp.]|nr:tandem-type lipoprotein [Staphylococcus sp.]
MVHSKKLVICISLIMLTIFIGGCGMMDKVTGKKPNKEEQIKQKFSKTLDMYPIKNLEDLYDKEGYRDEEFDKEYKGMWILSSKMVIQKRGENMFSRAMVLNIDRNKRTATGSFETRETFEDKDGMVDSIDKDYPIKMENNKIIPTKQINDEKLKKEIEEFKFFAQYADFKDLKKYKDGNISYNPSAPNYSAEYQLKNDEYNVKQLRKRYDIPTKKAPKLLLKGTGELEGSSVGYDDLEYTFVENKKENIFFTDFMNYVPAKE